MSGEGEGVFVVPIVFFTIVVLCGTIFIVTWLTKRSKDKTKDTTKAQNRGSSIAQKAKSGTSKPVKKKKGHFVKLSWETSSHKFEHPHLLATLKGHIGPLTGGDFSSNGKQFITSAEVVNGCPCLVPCIEAKECKKYKALNHNEDDASMWTSTSLSSCSTTPSDTEDSLTSSSSCSSKMSRRQKKNRKRKKHEEAHVKSKPNKNDDKCSFSKSEDEIRIESVTSSKKSKSPPGKNNRSVKLNKCKSDAEMHKLLLPLCVEVQERILSGYPYQTYRGTYVFKSFGFSRLESVLGNHRLVDAEIADVDLKNCSDVMDDESTSQNFIENSSDFNGNFKGDFKGDSNFQKCERCRQFFDVCGNGKTLCLFHPRKAVLTSEGSLRYTCCNSLKNGGGCQVYTYHVFHHLSLGINGPLMGYVSTRPLNRPPRVFGLDCEMVFTANGFEVARATLVNVFGEPMIDSFVIPEGEVLDYNTQFSGISEENLVNALTFKDLQELLIQIISSCDILVGHSLEGDLVVLKLLHRRVVDSSLLFLDSTHETIPGMANPLPRRQGLKSLVKEHLGQDIQVGGACGHDSLEDATASLNLVLKKVCGESVRSNRRKSKIAPVPPLLHAITA